MTKEQVEHGIQRNRKRILVVANDGIFTENIINHTVHLAGRLQYDLIALSVDAACEGESFRRRSAKSMKRLQSVAGSNAIHCDHMVRAGDLGTAVQDTIHEIKRIELVAIDSSTPEETIRGISAPVVRVFSRSQDNTGGHAMAVGITDSKWRQIGKTAGLGLLAAACYAVVFTHTETVMQYYTRGGVFAALPIATVLLFSFVHGSFAHSLWSLLGIEAMKKDRVRMTEKKVLEKRKRLRQRPRMYAYVNPFHRIERH